MTVFYSHSKEIDGKRIGSKLMKDHLDQVAKHTVGQLSESTQFSFPYDTLKELAKDVSYLHDLGKYMSYFQNYLLNQKPIDRDLKQHAQIGAIAAYNQWMKKDPILAIIAYTLIQRHHGDLQNMDDDRLLGLENKHVLLMLEKQIKDLNHSLHEIKKDIGIDPLYHSIPDKSDFKDQIEDCLEDKNNIDHYFLINYLFSLLIESDKLDASLTEHYSKISLPLHAVDEHIGSAKKSSGLLKEMSQNQIRNFVRFTVTSALQQTDILKQKLFTLTAPTGIGKTLTAIDFAIKLRQKIYENEGYEAQIICALPFINIIEQTLSEYEDKVFKGRAKVLAHYQFADIFGDGEGKKVGYNEDTDYNQKKMQTDTWQSDVVITSFVQFLETLIGNRNKLLKKFHHFCNSIVILDEVQTIRLDYLPLVGAMLYYLSEKLNTRILLMTATKPQVFELANRELLQQDKHKSGALELLPNYAEVFQLFKRTKIIPLIASKIEDESEFISLFSNYWSSEKSCLMVCNKVNRSIAVFNQLKELLSETGCDNPLYYLSTNITPIQRMEIILKIKADIKDGLKPLLVSTQVVEAGVDLDFDLGFRDLGPIDSIVQVAGRINREGKKGELAPLYIIDFGDCKQIYGDITDQQAKKALNSFDGEIEEPQYEQMVSRYFNQLANVKSFATSKSFYKAVWELNYNEIGTFRLIEETNSTSSVYIELSEDAVEIREAYQSFSNGEMTVAEFDKNFKRKFHQHIVSVPFYVMKQTNLEKMKPSESIYLVGFDELSTYYNMDTGFIRKDIKNTSAWCL